MGCKPPSGLVPEAWPVLAIAMRVATIPALGCAVVDAGLGHAGYWVARSGVGAVLRQRGLAGVVHAMAPAGPVAAIARAARVGGALLPATRVGSKNTESILLADLAGRAICVAARRALAWLRRPRCLGAKTILFAAFADGAQVVGPHAAKVAAKRAVARACAVLRAGAFLGRCRASSWHCMTLLEFGVTTAGGGALGLGGATPPAEGNTEVLAIQADFGLGAVLVRRSEAFARDRRAKSKRNAVIRGLAVRICSSDTGATAPGTAAMTRTPQRRRAVGRGRGRAAAVDRVAGPAFFAGRGPLARGFRWTRQHAHTFGFVVGDRGGVVTVRGPQRGVRCTGQSCAQPQGGKPSLCGGLRRWPCRHCACCSAFAGVLWPDYAATVGKIKNLLPQTLLAAPTYPNGDRPPDRWRRKDSPSAARRHCQGNWGRMGQRPARLGGA